MEYLDQLYFQIGVDYERVMAHLKPGSEDIVCDLLQHNICKHCCLRYLNEKNIDAYRNVDNYIDEVIRQSNLHEDYVPIPKRRRHNACSACVGLLQLSDDEVFLNKIAEQVLSAGFDSDDVTFALTLPITILLRDYAVWLYISDKYAEYYSDSFASAALRRSAHTVSVKEAWKLITAHRLAEKLNKTMNSGIDGSFHVNIQIEYDMDGPETNCLVEMFPDIFKNRANQKRKFHGEVLTRKSVENALPLVGLHYFRSFYPVPPRAPDCFVKCGNIECVKDSIYLAGRYNKYSRNLSQTPWLINGERRMDSSVEEIIGNPVSKIILHGGIKFSSSGREDVDVRTLGRGRPFILEVMNPRRTKLEPQDIRQLEIDINNSTRDVFVRDLQIVKKYDLVHIKLGEQTKTKTYNCFCLTKLMDGETVSEFREELNQLKEIKELIINQRTPIRVLHRRSLAVRPRTVFWMEAELHEQKNELLFFKLTLQVDAGTYIKEFVHGDFGRTRPNLSEILKREVDILALDVEEVALQWPPTVEYP